MIKPHGSDTLKPLFVYDTVRHQALTKEAANAALDAPNRSFGNLSHRQHLDNSGVDYQLISPRPYQMMHSESPAKIVQWFAEETNKAIALSCEVEPRFKGVAGLPQTMETSPATWMKPR